MRTSREVITTMELVVRKTDLLRELQLFQGIVERKNTIPILANVLIEANGDGTADEALDKGATYRIVVNSFLSDGGDGFSTLADGDDKLVGGLDIDSLADYLGANDPYTPTATDRISNQP